MKIFWRWNAYTYASIYIIIYFVLKIQIICPMRFFGAGRFEPNESCGDKMCPKLGKRWISVDGRPEKNRRKNTLCWINEEFLFFLLHFLNLNIVIWKFLHGVVRRRTRLSAATAANTSRKKSIIFSFFHSLHLFCALCFAVLCAPYTYCARAHPA